MISALEPLQTESWKGPRRLHFCFRAYSLGKASVHINGSIVVALSTSEAAVNSPKIR